MTLNGIWIAMTVVFLAVTAATTALELSGVTEALQDGDPAVFFGRV